jgi:hypothetical protein
MLLRKNQHSETMVKCIGIENIQLFHEELLKKYLSMNVKVEENLFNKLINTFRVRVL